MKTIKSPFRLASMILLTAALVGCAPLPKPDIGGLRKVTVVSAVDPKVLILEAPSNEGGVLFSGPGGAVPAIMDSVLGTVLPNVRLMRYSFDGVDAEQLAFDQIQADTRRAGHRFELSIVRRNENRLYETLYPNADSKAEMVEPSYRWDANQRAILTDIAKETSADALLVFVERYYPGCGSANVGHGTGITFCKYSEAVPITWYASYVFILVDAKTLGLIDTSYAAKIVEKDNEGMTWEKDVANGPSPRMTAAIKSQMPLTLRSAVSLGLGRMRLAPEPKY